MVSDALAALAGPGAARIGAVAEIIVLFYVAFHNIDSDNIMTVVLILC